MGLNEAGAHSRVSLPASPSPTDTQQHVLTKNGFNPLMSEKFFSFVLKIPIIIILTFALQRDTETNKLNFFPVRQIWLKIKPAKKLGLTSKVKKKKLI